MEVDRSNIEYRFLFKFVYATLLGEILNSGMILNFNEDHTMFAQTSNALRTTNHIGSFLENGVDLHVVSEPKNLI